MTDLDGEKIVGILAIVVGFGSFIFMNIQAFARIASRRIEMTFGPNDDIDSDRLDALKAAAKRLTDSGVLPVRILAQKRDV